MPVSKAQQKAVTKYVKTKYDRFGLTMPKGELDDIKTHASACGESVNGFIGRAIKETIARDGAQESAGFEGMSVPLPQENASQLISSRIEAHIEKTGEDEAAFLERATDSTIKRDIISLEMGINPATGEKMKEGEPA